MTPIEQGAAMTKHFRFISILLLLTASVFAQEYVKEGDFEFYVEVYDDAIDVSVTGYKGKNKSITIPSHGNGLPVNFIGEETFAGKRLTNVIIPDSVIDISRRAFADNALTAITIPANVAWISWEAFAGNRLTAVVIPESVVAISGDAFKGNRITQITIGANVDVRPADDVNGSAFELGFADFYWKNDRKAGTYRYINGKWNRQ
jgi:hypothetical protein